MAAASAAAPLLQDGMKTAGHGCSQWLLLMSDTGLPVLSFSDGVPHSSSLAMQGLVASLATPAAAQKASLYSLSSGSATLLWRPVQAGSAAGVLAVLLAKRAAQSLAARAAAARELGEDVWTALRMHLGEVTLERTLTAPSGDGLEGFSAVLRWLTHPTRLAAEQRASHPLACLSHRLPTVSAVADDVAAGAAARLQCGASDVLVAVILGGRLVEASATWWAWLRGAGAARAGGLLLQRAAAAAVTRDASHGDFTCAAWSGLHLPGAPHSSTAVVLPLAPQTRQRKPERQRRGAGTPPSNAVALVAGQGDSVARLLVLAPQAPPPLPALHIPRGAAAVPAPPPTPVVAAALAVASLPQRPCEAACRTLAEVEASLPSPAAAAAPSFADAVTNVAVTAASRAAPDGAAAVPPWAMLRPAPWTPPLDALLAESGPLPLQALALTAPHGEGGVTATWALPGAGGALQALLAFCATPLPPFATDATLQRKDGLHLGVWAAGRLLVAVALRVPPAAGPQPCFVPRQAGAALASALAGPAWAVLALRTEGVAARRLPEGARQLEPTLLTLRPPPWFSAAATPRTASAASVLAPCPAAWG